MFSIALLLYAGFAAHADFGVCPWSLDVYSVNLPDQIPNPEFENPKSDDLKPSEDKPIYPEDKPVIDPAPAPVETPRPSPEPLERPPDEK